MELTAQCNPGEMSSPPPLSKRLENRKELLERDLAKVNQAIELMGKNPDISTLINTISQLHV